MRAQSGKPLDYWSTSREPWPSLLFIAPFLIVYELSTLMNSGLPASRNGADLWIRQLGHQQGFAWEWLFPLLAPLFLLTWQFVGRRPWTWSYETLSGMFAESLMFAMLLVLLGQLSSLMFPLNVSTHAAAPDVARVISFLGAGIYEEMLFRLTLLPLTFVMLRAVLIPRGIAMAGTVLISSWLFATAHYVGSTALFSPQELHSATLTVVHSPELWFSYTFRLLAGILFSILFWFRGFGIAVGCHILYDVIVGVLLSGIA